MWLWHVAVARRRQAATDEEVEEEVEEENLVDTVRGHPAFESFCTQIFGGIEAAFKKCVLAILFCLFVHVGTECSLSPLCVSPG